MSESISIEDLIAKARCKAASDSDLCRKSGVSRATLWRMVHGKLKTHARADTVGKLTNFLLGHHRASK